MPWDQGFKWPWENNPPPPPPPVNNSPLNWNKRPLQKAKEQTDAEKQRQKQMQDMINQGLCPPIQTANPDQKGKNNEWNTFKNSLGQTDSTSGHMRGYDGNHAYMGPGRAGTYTDGGSTTTYVDPRLGQSNYQGPTGPAQTTNASGADVAAQLGGRLQ
ncbi:MAG: hypothetical protein K2Y22_02910 [Candidatus Obscuribacterales bacterium]|nr:hypothetical protein [Candidatus Obscuribacterales bacterium]